MSGWSIWRRYGRSYSPSMGTSSVTWWPIAGNTVYGRVECSSSNSTILPAEFAGVIAPPGAMRTSWPRAPSSSVGSVKGTAPITSTGSEPPPSVSRVSPPAAARSRPGVSPSASGVGCHRSIVYSSNSICMPGTSASSSASQSIDNSCCSLAGDRRPKALNSSSNERTSSAVANSSASTEVGQAISGPEPVVDVVALLSLSPVQAVMEKIARQVPAAMDSVRRAFPRRRVVGCGMWSPCGPGCRRRRRPAAPLVTPCYLHRVTCRR